MSKKTSQRRASHGSASPPWNRKDLLSNPARDYEVLTKDLEAHLLSFENLRETLSPNSTAEQFLDALRLAEAITRTIHTLGAYAYLWFSENTKAQAARAFKAKVEELQAGAEVTVVRSSDSEPRHGTADPRAIGVEVDALSLNHFDHPVQ